MPAPLQIDAGFSGGMRRDYDRAQMPTATAWNLVDWIPDELGAPLRARGAWSYIGASMSLVTAVQAMLYAPFSTGAKTLGVSQNGHLWEVVTPSDLGSVPSPAQNPFFHRDTVIITNSDGTTTPYKYTTGGGAVALAGAPAGMYGGVFKDYSILANSSANNNRVWFSSAGDPTTWDTTAGYVDTTGKVKAIAPMRALILIMHEDRVERLRGTTPPPGTDMTLEGFMSVGCLDAFSVVKWNDQVIFASAQGVYLTDGAAYVNLIDAGGMQTYWQSLMQSYSAATYKLSAGVYQSHYILSITNSTSFVDCLVCDLRRRTWWRFSNFPGSSFASTVAGQEELYMGLASAGRVAKISPCWNLPASPVTQTDASGTGPRTVLETAYHRGWTRWHRKWIPGMGLQKWDWLYADYDLRDGGATPTYSLSYTINPETGASYTALDTLAATSGYDPPTAGRARSALRFRANGVALKLAQNNDAADQRLYAFEADYQPIDTGSLR